MATKCESAVERATANFYAWEIRGRGWQFYDTPVLLEPAYVPFYPITFGGINVLDDAHHPTLLGKALTKTLFVNQQSQNAKSQTDFARLYEQRAHVQEHDETLKLFKIYFPSGCDLHAEIQLELLQSLCNTKFPVSFEVVGTTATIEVQFVCRRADAFRLRSQLGAHFLGAVISESDEIDPDDLNSQFDEISIIEFALRDEFQIPIYQLGSAKIDSFAGFFGLLENLNPGEQITLQVLFQGTKHPWQTSIIKSVSSSDGSCFFADFPEMLQLAEDKVSSPLTAATMRVVIESNTSYRLHLLTDEVIKCISNQSDSGNNRLFPLTKQTYLNNSRLYRDICNRTSHITGMLLNIGELGTFAHFPNKSIVSKKLFNPALKTKEAPEYLKGRNYIIGENFHANRSVEVSLSVDQRLKHVHIIGATGTGKSTLLTNLISQDIEHGLGLTLLDPHGDLVDDVISLIPENRMSDVVLVDPSDFEYPIGVNLLSAQTEFERIVLSSDLVSAIRRTSTSWGDQMTSILANAIDAFLESKTGGTLLDLRRFLVENDFRNSFLKSVSDPSIHQFWRHEYPMLRKGSISPILIRLDTFLRPKVIRNMMAQRTGLDFMQLMETDKIVLVKLSQGLIGEENSYLLGSLFVTKIQQAAQARQVIQKTRRNPYFLYIDEFQNFITPSVSSILSGSRKYGLGLILAHQTLEQIARVDQELAHSILSNPATRICFRVGEMDARRLEGGFSCFDSQDLQNLSVGQAVAKVEVTTQDFNISTRPIQQTDNEARKSKYTLCLQSSRQKFSHKQQNIEQNVESFAGMEIQALGEVAVRDLDDIAEEDVILDSPEVREIIGPNASLEEQAESFILRSEEQRKISEHRILQMRIKQVAEVNGFKAVIEESINSGEGRVDVGLVRDDLKIAIEVSVTNSEDYEVDNISKCLKAGYQKVVMCSRDTRHLEKIKDMATGKLTEETFNCVYFMNPDEVFGYIESMNQGKFKTERIKGYRVKVTYRDN